MYRFLNMDKFIDIIKKSGIEVFLNRIDKNFGPEISLSELKPGDHIYTIRDLKILSGGECLLNCKNAYDHHGIVMSNENGIVRVAHPYSENKSKSGAFTVTDISNFSQGNPVRRAQYGLPEIDVLRYAPGTAFKVARLEPDRIIDLASQWIADGSRYNLISNNCEMFAFHCSTGSTEKSQQIETLREWIKIITPFVNKKD